MAKILILGGGFGGLLAAEHLSQTLSKKHRITLVSPDPRFIFYPALVRLAFGECTQKDISFSLLKKLRKLGVRFIEAEVIDIDPQKQRVSVTGDDISGDIAYDYLIVAIGRRLATEKVAGFFDHAHHILNTEAAGKFENSLRDFKKGTIVVGLSPAAELPVPVCETAFALAKRFETGLGAGDIRINVVFPESIEEAFGGAEIHRELTESFDQFGIEQTTSFPVVEITENKILSRNGGQLGYDLLLLLPPFRGQTVVKRLGASDDFGFLITDEKLRVSGYSNVFAVGDIVELPGPKLASSAVEQARVASQNVIALIAGGEPNEVYYHEIAAIIDAGGAESIYLHYGFWDDSLYRVRKGKIWNWGKRIHDRVWQKIHQP